ncbi:MAG: hypothetical protein NVSMB49_21380 [Ktedonobacteraceae bacterium]
MASELGHSRAEATAHALERVQSSTLTAQDIMNRQVRTIGPNQPIQEAARILIETQLRNLPVVDTNGILLEWSHGQTCYRLFEAVPS